MPMSATPYPTGIAAIPDAALLDVAPDATSRSSAAVTANPP